MADIYESLPVSEKARCLAINKAKARFIRDDFLRERLNQQQQKLAIKVVKFSTLLTEQKLDQVRTKQLRQFEKDMKQYCRVMAIKNTNTQQRITQSGKISYFLQEIKRSTKITLMKDKKAKSQPKMDNNFGLQTAKNNNNNSRDKSRQIIPLGNTKIKEALSSENKKIKPRHSLQLNGKRVSSHLINLIQKLEQMQSIENTFQQNKKVSKGQTQEDILVSSSFLKKENERLSTAIEGAARSKFKPMGHITQQQPKQFQMSKIQSCQKPHSIILHSSMKRKIIHDDIKKRRKTQMASICKNLEKASLQLDEGLPIVIRDTTPLKQILHQEIIQRQIFKTKRAITEKSTTKIFEISRKDNDKPFHREILT